MAPAVPGEIAIQEGRQPHGTALGGGAVLLHRPTPVLQTPQSGVVPAKSGLVVNGEVVPRPRMFKVADVPLFGRVIRLLGLAAAVTLHVVGSVLHPVVKTAQTTAVALRKSTEIESPISEAGMSRRGTGRTISRTGERHWASRWGDGHESFQDQQERTVELDTRGGRRRMERVVESDPRALTSLQSIAEMGRYWANEQDNVLLTREGSGRNSQISAAYAKALRSIPDAVAGVKPGTRPLEAALQKQAFMLSLAKSVFPSDRAVSRASIESAAALETPAKERGGVEVIYSGVESTGAGIGVARGPREMAGAVAGAAEAAAAGAARGSSRSLAGPSMCR